MTITLSNHVDIILFLSGYRKESQWEGHLLL